MKVFTFISYLTDQAMYCGVPEEDPNKLVALILAGGMSSRMGKDKGTLELNGQRWVDYIAGCCSKINLTAFYSINVNQTEEYMSFLPSENILVDAVDVKGPLAGLFSFYLAYPDTDVLLLPCDMIQLNETVLQELIDAYDTIQIGHDILVYQHADESIEPMPGIYTSEALKKLYWLFVSGALKKHSLKYCIDISNSFFLPIHKEQESFFINANTPEDLFNKKI